MSAEQITKAIQEKISSIVRVAMPGIIEKYDFKECKASIKIDMQEPYQNGTSVDYPVISNVPIIFPRCGGAEIIMPIKRGDTCLIIFSDRNIDSWLLGASGKKPENRRMHHLNDAVAIMGLSPFNKPTGAKNDIDFIINYDGSNITLKPKGIIEVASAKEISVKTENIVINSKTVSIKIAETVNIECQNASIKASGKIITETPELIQKGNLKIEGNVEINGVSILKGKLETKAGIENSGSNLVSNGKTFETHTHDYEAIASVTSPQGPCTVTKVPKNTGKTI